MKHTIKIIVPDALPPGKLADAEIHFEDDLLAGLKLMGFAVWERRGGNGRNVTFPARQWSVNGDRRSFALLRPASTDHYTTADYTASLRDAILKAYTDWEEAQAKPPVFDATADDPTLGF